MQYTHVYSCTTPYTLSTNRSLLIHQATTRPQWTSQVIGKYEYIRLGRFCAHKPKCCPLGGRRQTVLVAGSRRVDSYSVHIVEAEDKGRGIYKDIY